MEINDQTYAALQQYLQQTFDPRTQKQAEQSLAQVEVQRNFPLLVIKLIGDQSADQTLRFAASVFFKNYVKRHWVPDDENANKIYPEDRAAIKSQIVDLMISVPERLQFQVSEALSIIASSDFPEDWQELLPTLISKFSTTDYQVNNGVLQTAHSIFKPWRSQFRTDTLFMDIKYVLDNFCEPYRQLFATTDKLITDYANDAAALQILSQSLLLLVKIYYDLNCQDLPEFFEDNMGYFMELFHKYLTYNNALLQSDDEEEAGVLEKVKAGICEIIELYTQRYEEEFKQLPTFFTTVLQLLISTPQEPKYDVLASKALSFLTSVVRLYKHANIYGEENTMKLMCEKIALPNMALRSNDEELFEDDPIEYIRRDLEGSDSDTRRRAAADFVRGLMEHFESQVTSIFLGYIQHYLQQYSVNPEAHWKDKNTAIFLLTAIATKSGTAQHGATVINANIDVVDFFSKYILSDLQSPIASGNPILKVDAIKYLYTFRHQLTKEQLVTVFPLLVEHLKSDSYVVYTYSAVTIERILFIKKGNAMLFTQSDIQPYAETLLELLFKQIEKGQTPEKLAENDYLMRAIMRVIITSRQGMTPYVNVIMSKLTNILAIVSKNPSNPRFNHYVFESIGALIRFICPSSPAAVAEFENLLFGPFQVILAQDIQEFTPYVFQLLAQLLDFHTGTELSAAYIALLDPLLNPALWEYGNIPALVPLVQSYLSRGVDTILARNKLTPILGVFQKLMASRQHDHYGFGILNAIVMNVPLDVISPYLRAIVTYVLTRLQSKTNKKTGLMVHDKFTRGMLVWICLFLALDKQPGGPDVVIEAFDALQPSLFAQMLNLVVLPELQKVAEPKDRKTCAIGLTRLLTQSDKMMAEPYVGLWPTIFTALIKLLELPQDLAGDDLDELYNLDLEESGYQATFAKLATAAPVKEDAFASIPEPTVFLAQGIVSLSQRHPGKVGALAQQSEGANEFLPKYFERANLNMAQLS
ncbi:putative importin-alpha export receptor [Umbelopsis sp. AD052]|nr:putative importin-alpha export receptor [Umbelopsis sp. AD052]